MVYDETDDPEGVTPPPLDETDGGTIQVPERATATRTRILIAEDDDATRNALSELLTSWGYDVEAVADGDLAYEAIERSRPTIVLSDLMMPGKDGIALLEAVQKLPPPHPSFIVLTAYATIESAIEATRKGAYDYLQKPMEDGQHMRTLLIRAKADWDKTHELEVLRRQNYLGGRVGEMIGTSAPMREVFRLVEQVARTDASVLLLGESGTGKDLVSRTIHGLSSRGAGPFVAMNCAAIPESLLESEIFGHEKGAFTGALAPRAGCFELADHGTLFLDEIAEMAPALQAKLLRVLEDRTIRRVGGKVETPVDVRVLAATNRDIGDALAQKVLRGDLYYRLNVFSIHLPPLRDRIEDVPALAQAFLTEFRDKYAKNITHIEDDGMARLLAHSWPGNVRELRNLIERATIVATPPSIRAADLALVPGATPVETGPAPAAGKTIDTIERELILATLEKTRQNKTRAAEILGISLKTLHNKLRRYRAEAGADQGQEAAAEGGA
jgi:DNA-binding NtrC family response regulator